MNYLDDLFANEILRSYAQLLQQLDSITFSKIISLLVKQDFFGYQEGTLFYKGQSITLDSLGGNKK